MKTWLRNIRRLAEILLLGILIIFVLSMLQLVSNSRFVSSVTSFIRQSAVTKKLPDQNSINQTLSALTDKTQLYIQLIEEKHLYEGMVINRLFNGSPIDICDSLLFSSLYFSALKDLGHDDLAKKQWLAIEKNQEGGNWYRHPFCRETPPSRDMIVGLLISLSKEPEHFKTHLENFFHQVEQRNGYFADGHFSVSYLSPGVGEIFRKFSILHGSKYFQMPPTVRSSFSTSEWSVALTKAGYRLHLVGLQSWLEMSLNQGLYGGKNIKIRSAFNRMRRITSPFVARPIHEQRLEYITQTLLEKSPRNLFFKFLRFQSAAALSPAVVLEMMKELLTMEKQFPADRLPNDCDRRADYLWQRADDEYESDKSSCRRVFSGVDFVWMSALLQSALAQEKNATPPATSESL